MTPGLYIQVYRDAIKADPRRPWMDSSAAKREWLMPHLTMWALLGVRGVAWHGFSTELTAAALAPLTAMCRGSGMLSLAAYGMDATDPAGKALRVGNVLVSDACDGVVLDAEGAWDKGGKAAAATFRDAFLPYRAKAPSKPVVDQPWPMPLVHSGFPYDEFGACVDARAPQVYVNDWRGSDRFARVTAESARQWAELDKRITVKRPVWATFQGYGWDSIRDDLVRVFDRAEREPVLVWCEPVPSDTFMHALRDYRAKRCAP